MNLIVGIGELLWDVYPDGRKVAGGAPFNFAFHCHQLGHPAVIVSRVGDDDLGRELRAEVRRLGLTDEFIQTDREHPTGTVEVTLDAAGLPAYTITENVAWDYLADAESFETAAVCFGTLALRHPVSRAAILQFVNLGPNAPLPLRVLDVNIRLPFRPTLAALRGCYAVADWVKVSSDDVRTAQRAFDEVESEWMQIAEAQGEAKVHIATMGQVGCEVKATDGEPFSEPGVSAKVVDTVGAGDAFAAAMVCLHLEGRSLRECARFANHYAARVCEHVGATPRIDRREVEAAAFSS